MPRLIEAAGSREIHENRNLYYNTATPKVVPVPKKGPKGPPPGPLKKNKPTPEKVLQAFNTWAFKREQPSDPELIREVIAEAMTRGEPLPFVLYWGKGPRCQLDEPDITCLDYLAALARRVKEAYEPGAAIKLICTDTHARLNGHHEQGIKDYFAAVIESAHGRGFGNCLLSELVQTAEAAGVDADPEEVSIETLQRLGVSAAKWYRGEATPEEAARKYFKMNMIERRAVELAFPRSIFVTFNGSELRCLFPQHLPIFYMYSLRRGVSVKPWFLPPVAPTLQASGDWS
jgi:hypothetical protein